jgi:hypothetical protein
VGWGGVGWGGVGWGGVGWGGVGWGGVEVHIHRRNESFFIGLLRWGEEGDLFREGREGSTQAISWFVGGQGGGGCLSGASKQ